jgi:hypothetical protein
MRFNSRYNRISIHEGASSKRKAIRSGALRYSAGSVSDLSLCQCALSMRLRSLTLPALYRNLRNYTAGELSKAEFLWQFVIRHKPNGQAW